jgi:DNA-binding NarL/FixJ family response regulator
MGSKGQIMPEPCLVQHEAHSSPPITGVLCAEVLTEIKDSARFTERQMQIVPFLLAGEWNERIIGRRLRISRGTVSSHLRRMYARTGTENHGQLASFLFAQYLQRVHRVHQ